MEEMARNTVVSVPNTATQLSDNKFGRRSSILIRNLDPVLTVNVFFSDTEVAVAGRSITLYPREYVVESAGDNYTCWQGAITAIASAAGPASVSVFEKVKI